LEAYERRSIPVSRLGQSGAVQQIRITAKQPGIARNVSRRYILGLRVHLSFSLVSRATVGAIQPITAEVSARPRSSTIVGLPEPTQYRYNACRRCRPQASGLRE